jgi:hypothetical protein
MLICTSCGNRFRSSRVGLICDACRERARAFKPPRRPLLRRVPAIVPEHADPRPPHLRVAAVTELEPGHDVTENGGIRLMPLDEPDVA